MQVVFNPKPALGVPTKYKCIDLSNEFRGTKCRCYEIVINFEQPDKQIVIKDYLFVSTADGDITRIGQTANSTSINFAETIDPLYVDPVYVFSISNDKRSVYIEITLDVNYPEGFNGWMSSNLVKP